MPRHGRCLGTVVDADVNFWIILDGGEGLEHEPVARLVWLTSRVNKPGQSLHSDERITSFQHKTSYQVEEGLAFEATRSDACAFEVGPDHVNKVLISLAHRGRTRKRGQRNVEVK